MRTRVHPNRAAAARRGFTLIETALTTIIVGVGILASLTLFGTSTRQNNTGAQMTTATLLANHIQETMAGLSFNDPAYSKTYFGPEPGQTLASYDDVDDFDGQTFNPPIDSLRQPIAAQSQYSQVVSVVPVYATKLSSNTNPASPDLAKTTYTGAVRVTVIIMYKANASASNDEVYRASWIRVASQ